MKRIKLKLFRIRLDLSQDEMASKLGISRSQYALIENGRRNGTMDFWRNLQNTFGISDSDMWELTNRKDEENAQNH